MAQAGMMVPARMPKRHWGLTPLGTTQLAAAIEGKRA